MKMLCRWEIAILLLASLHLSGCKAAEEAAAEEEAGPATVEHFDQASEPAKITLTEEAAKRLDVQTAPSTEAQVEGATRTIIPYAAVLYDTDGDTWTYLNPEPLVYVRHHIVVDRIDVDHAVLAEPLPAGTSIVTVGAAELYGSEVEFEEE